MTGRQHNEKDEGLTCLFSSVKTSDGKNGTASKNDSLRRLVANSSYVTLVKKQEGASES